VKPQGGIQQSSRHQSLCKAEGRAFMQFLLLAYERCPKSKMECSAGRVMKTWCCLCMNAAQSWQGKLSWEVAEESVVLAKWQPVPA